MENIKVPKPHPNLPMIDFKYGHGRFSVSQLSTGGYGICLYVSDKFADPKQPHTLEDLFANQNVEPIIAIGIKDAEHARSWANIFLSAANTIEERWPEK